MSSSSQRMTLSGSSRVSSESDFSDLSLESVASITKTPRGFSVRYKWTSNWDMIIFQLASLITVEACFVIPTDVFTFDPTTVLHYVIFYVAIAIPFVYMQTSAGQYSQLGVVFLKYLTPIGHGIGFVMCINTFWSCIDKGVVMGDVSLYFLSAMKAELPWMECPENNANCWVASGNCTHNCFTEEKQLSALVFWREVFMKNVNLEATTLKYSAPILPRAVVVGLAWAGVYSLVRLRISSYKRIIMMNMYVAAVLFVLVLFVCLLAQGGSLGLSLYTAMDWKALFYFESWTSVVLGSTQLLGFSKASYVVYGSYMDPKAPANLLTIAYVFFHLFWVLFGCLLGFASLGILAARSYTPVENLHRIFYDPMPQLILVPQSLGYLGAPQLWCSIYFFLCFLLYLNHLVVQVDIVERCITDLNPRFKHYSHYTLGALCLIGLIFGIILVSKDAFIVHYELDAKVIIPVETLESAFLCSLICWVYGVQRFSDDIHFMVGTQPAKYWKICWYIMPVVQWMGIIYSIYDLDVKDMLHFITFAFCAAYISPVPIMGVIGIFQHLKRHNLIGVIQAQERWGPPDSQERHLRHLFNPREETRSRRRNEFCKHKCFLKSKILKLAIEQQERFRMEDEDEVRVQEGSDDSGESDEG